MHKFNSVGSHYSQSTNLDQDCFSHSYKLQLYTKYLCYWTCLILKLDLELYGILTLTVAMIKKILATSLHQLAPSIMIFWSECFYVLTTDYKWLMWVFLLQSFLCRLHYFIIDHINKLLAAPDPHPDYIFFSYPTNILSHCPPSVLTPHHPLSFNSFPLITLPLMQCPFPGSLCSYFSQGSECWVFVSDLSILHIPQLPINHTQRHEGLLFHYGSFPWSRLQTRLPFFNNEDISHSGSSC